MADKTRLQSFQRGPSGRVLQLEAHYHTNSHQYVVLSDDVFRAYSGAANIMNGTVVVSWARDAALRL